MHAIYKSLHPLAPASQSTHSSSPSSLEESAPITSLLSMSAILFLFTDRFAMLSCFSHVQLCATPWTVARQAPLCIGFSRQEYWSGQPFPSPEDLPNPGIKPRSPALQADFLSAKPQGKPNSWSEQPILSPADLPDPEIEPRSPALQADSLPTEISGKPTVHRSICVIFWILHVSVASIF